MKTIGLIGGMSWESTSLYYRYLNSICRDRLGGLHSARIILWSFDFDEVARRQHAGDWRGAADLLIDAAVRLEQAGAAAILICTNTMHRVADAVEKAVGVPLLHIADAAAKAILTTASRRPILLGTAFTMEQDFYRRRLKDKYSIEVMVPDAAGRAIVHRVIYDELCCGEISPKSRAEMMRIIENLRAKGADGLILGCTELPLLIDEHDVDVPVFDTTRLHAEFAAEFSIADEGPA